MNPNVRVILILMNPVGRLTTLKIVKNTKSSSWNEQFLKCKNISLYFWSMEYFSIWGQNHQITLLIYLFFFFQDTSNLHLNKKIRMSGRGGGRVSLFFLYQASEWTVRKESWLGVKINERHCEGDERTTFPYNTSKTYLEVQSVVSLSQF